MFKAVQPQHSDVDAWEMGNISRLMSTDRIQLTYSTQTNRCWYTQSIVRPFWHPIRSNRVQ